MPRQATDDAQWHAAIADFPVAGSPSPSSAAAAGYPCTPSEDASTPAAPPSPASASAQPDARKFIPVTLIPDPSADSSDPLVLILDGGHRIAVGVGFDPGTLRRLVDALGDRP